MNEQNLTFTVGIPTYYGGPALVRAAESILSSKNVDKFRLIVTVDGNPLKKEIADSLKKMGAEVIENKERGGQVTRIKQIISLCDTDILILTQDDILFDPLAIFHIIKKFQDDPDLTMVGARVMPVTAETIFESAIGTGVRMVHYIGDNWKNGDNYLLASGRCLAFRSDTAKKLNIPDAVINSDAYLYFENKKTGGKFSAAREAVIYNKSPQKLSEHIKQNKKFDYSKSEASHYLKADLSDEYAIPKNLAFKAYIRELVQSPLAAIIYLPVMLYAKLQKNKFINVERFWETDVTTKR